MKTTADFLDELRAYTGATSDGKLALVMQWQRAQLTRYRQKRETFSDDTARKIAAALGRDERYASFIMACMALQRAKTPENRSAWQHLAQLAEKAAAGVLLALGIAAGAPSPADAAGFDNSTLGAQPGQDTHMPQFGPDPRNAPKSWRERAARALSAFARYLGTTPAPISPEAL